jgi:hypothetical protein
MNGSLGLYGFISASLWNGKLLAESLYFKEIVVALSSWPLKVK